VSLPVQKQSRGLSADAAPDHGNFHSVPTDFARRAIHRGDWFHQMGRQMTTDAFELDRRLAQDTIVVTDWSLSRILLMNDRRFPWLILVPRRAGMVEAFDLGEDERALLWREANAAAAALKAMTGCRKINIAALGNVVSQLHVHVVARYEGDAAWPGPVWGKGGAEPYAAAEVAALVERFAALRGSTG
jgi:diadenosine tetraphosphate (Ap4A) HIT family hydrolase